MRTATLTLEEALAAATAPGTPRPLSNAAPTTSPPTCATGKRTLTASRTNLNPRHVPSCGRPLAGKSSHKPPPPPTRHQSRDGAHHHHEQNSPTDARNRVADRADAGPDRERDDCGDPCQPGCYTGVLDHCYSQPAPNDLVAATAVGSANSSSGSCPAIRPHRY